MYVCVYIYIFIRKEKKQGWSTQKSSIFFSPFYETLYVDLLLC